jgi:calpain
VPKTKKSDGSWWMSFTDFILQFDKVCITKIFPESWEIYSIESEWSGKTNGGSNIIFYIRMSNAK